MGKAVHDDVLDAALDFISTNAAKLVVLSGEPADYTAATTTPASSGVMLADSAALSGASFTGPADGTSGGRKLTVAAQSAVDVDYEGTATHVAIVSSTAVLVTTTCSSQALAAATQVDVPAWNITFNDPT